jgi:transcriptional regulator with XRE-family HTH domain
MRTVAITRLVPVYADRLRAERELQKMTQAGLAVVLHVDTSTVSRWETGAAEPSVSEFYRWCDALDVSPDHALAWHE